jgi:hypothetical protein
VLHYLRKKLVEYKNSCHRLDFHGNAVFKREWSDIDPKKNKNEEEEKNKNENL